MFSPIRIDARNPSPMTGSGNATYLIAAPGRSALLVDAGVAHPEHLEQLRSELARVDARLETVAVTHWHGDHASGAPAIAQAHPSATFAKYRWSDEDDKIDVAWTALGDGMTLPAGDDTLVVVHTPGHSPDHLAFWHEDSRTLFAGDLVIQGSTVMIHWSHGGDLAQYLQSLERVLRLKPKRLLPAHGGAVDNPEALLRTYIDHRLLRERQVLAALWAGHDTVSSIAESIYHGLAAALMPAAHETVRAHLEKLRQDGRVTESDERWRRH
jgi:glyoxylase-like metal-dependent hydrolase (beta-lactamase superfamily II)